MVDVQEDLRTIGFLRGRLLAERQASKAANEEAERMGSKLMEFKNQLKEETKMRNKAEKKLRFLKMKLESLKLPVPLVESEQSSSSVSDIPAHSCKSLASTSGLKDSEEFESESESRPHSQITTSADPEMTEKIDYDSASSGTIQPPHDTSNEHSNSSPSSEDFSMRSEMEADDRNESDSEDYVDNSLALVPASDPIPTQYVKPESKNGVKKITSGSVRDALDALRLARETIQRSMESRQMIRVGHS